MKKLWKLLTLCFAVFFLVSCGSNAGKNEFDNTINKTITSGSIKGHKDTKNKVIEWLGIPYAKAPVNELRWKAPRKVDKWKKTLDASKAGNQAIQFSNGKLSGSEDALNLDVVRPDTKKKKLPVMNCPQKVGHYI